jgi:hypothetical protein
MEPQQVPNEQPHELAGDLLRGADEIAEFIFGARGSRRKIRPASNPHFSNASKVCRASDQLSHA